MRGPFLSPLNDAADSEGTGEEPAETEWADGNYERRDVGEVTTVRRAPETSSRNTIRPHRTHRIGRRPDHRPRNRAPEDHCNQNCHPSCSRPEYHYAADRSEQEDPEDKHEARS